MGVSRTSILASIALALVWPVSPPRAAVDARSWATGVISGIATTKEAAPRPIRATIDPQICGQSLPDESVLVDAAGHLANVVVTVAGLKTPAPAEILVTNEKCAFVPRVSIMRPGGALKMSSKDPMLHTMHAAAADGRAFFNISIPMPNVTLSRSIDKAGVVTLSCSTHTWMRGYLVVTDERAVATGPDGKFQIDGLPAGMYELHIWHETLKASPMKVVVKDGQTTTADVTLARSGA